MRVTMQRKLDMYKDMLIDLKRIQNMLHEMLSYDEIVPNFDAMDTSVFTALQQVNKNIKELESSIKHLDDTIFIKTLQ